ncbi:MAG: NAD+ synthase [Candidatus Eisenbacteria bacterium]
MVRIALAQINVTVGDIRGNGDRIVEFLRRAEREGADLVAFPELAVSGYPPEDLLLRGRFLDDCRGEVERIAVETRGTAAVVGFPERAGAGAHNAAAVLQNGRVLGVYRKNRLPNYGVFDEERYFRPGEKSLLLDIENARVAVHICEDSWIVGSRPVECARETGANLILNISASPYHLGKVEIRRQVLAAANAKCGTPSFYVNLVGGQDELIFDGGSMVVSGGGAILAIAERFEEDLLLYDVDVSNPGERPLSPGEEEGWEIVRVEPIENRADRLPVRPRPIRSMAREEEVYHALLLGTRDYFRKNGFTRAVVGISGGIDSALAASIARDALGPDNVIGVTMPGRYTSAATRADADAVADRLGIELVEIPIQPVVEAYGKALGPCFAGTEPGVAEENIQARIRGNLLMALSNKFGWLVLNTGNKSETAVGYCTLYGDMAGGLAILKDVPKTFVYALAAWRNTWPDGPAIPASVIARPPSAELREDQKDSDSLPEYSVLDPILEAYVEHDMSIEEIVERLGDRETVEHVIRLVDANEYKRRQAPPGLKITPKAFGKDRRLPITNRFR